MKKHLLHSLKAVLIILILIVVSCSAAPPAEPDNGFQPYSAPEAPTGVEATNGYADTITVRWNEVEGATSYQIWAVEANKYGSSSSKTNLSNTYATLIERGFQLLDVVTETSFKLSGESSNASYVFSIVAMKSVRSTVSHDSVLYSDPSSYVQGGTIGEIRISAVANSEVVAVYWDISNVTPVLDNSGSGTPLYSYKLYISYKLTSDTEWSGEEELDVEALASRSCFYPASSLDIDTEYDFKLHLVVLDENGKTINSVESATYTILTDSTLIPESVTDVKATTGEKSKEVTLSWAVPVLPQRNDLKPVFTIQRSTDGTKWTTIEKDLSVENGTETTSYTDTSVEDNVSYSYRIINGYVLKERDAIYQTENNAAVISNVFSYWFPADITFDYALSEDNKSGKLTVSYSYNPPVEKEIKVYTGGTCRLETNLNSYTDLEEIEGNTYEISIENEEIHPIRYYSFYFRAVSAEGNEILKVFKSSDVTLGETGAVNLISSFTASSDWIGVIQLKWTEENDDISYELYEDNTLLEGYTINRDNRDCSISLERSAGESHNYRIKATKTDNSYDIENTSGYTFSKPYGLEASDSTSIDNIKITWPVSDNENIKYRLLYSEDSTSWKELTSSEGEATLDAKKDGTDGKPYYFKLQAYNTTQIDTPCIESDIEEGSVFGVALMNVSIPESGLNPDAITITWNAVEGAASYKIYRDEEFLKTVKNATSYSDTVDSIENRKKSDTPLNEEYSYTVIPVMADGTTEAVPGGAATAAGKLFAPPTNIRASKGTTVDSITVTWDKVEGATKYELERYEATIVNGDVITSGTNIGTMTTVVPSYAESTDKIIVFRVRAVRTETIDGEEVEIASDWQDGSETEENILGFTESSHVGYGLGSVSTLSLSSATAEDGYCAPYVVVTWTMVPGATSYTLKNSIGGNVTIDVSSLSYDKNNTTTNGKGENESGFLSYNPTTQQYTYNDYSGRMTNTFAITKYTITAGNGIDNSAAKENGSRVYRQPTAEDWINIVNSILKPAFNYVNNQEVKHTTWGVTYTDKYNGDWWPARDCQISYMDSFNFTLDSSSSYKNNKNYLEINSYKDSQTGLTLTTTSKILFDVSDGFSDDSLAGYLGTDPLETIGYDGNGTIKVTGCEIDGGKFKNFTVRYNNVNVRSNGGSFFVTIEGSSEKEISNDSSFIKVL